ncbi:MAG TPA: hypothetical protein VHY10_16405 [Xanthobacteraceae bacterium]|jgi:hypothetical protein|nr:hypothetical protein [Xanthobacteraceae bacterium]
MPITLAKTAFGSGEISPALWAHVDLAKYLVGAATLRNCFVSVRGGAYSRAGTLFCGQASQPASAASTAPRIVPFQFQISQSYIIELGDGYARFLANGAYITETPLTVTAASNANPCALTVPGNDFAVGDWLACADFTGLTELNGETVVVSGLSGSSFTIADAFGNPINSLAYGTYMGAGMVARLYTVTMPYAAIDLPYLKWAQSADVMSLTLVNTATLTEYQPADLERLASNDWTLLDTTFATAIAAPATCSATPSTTLSSLSSTANAPAAQYAYVATAVDGNGEESVASPVAYTPASNTAGSVDISVTAGSVTVTCAAVAGAVSYNFYRAPAAIWNTGPSSANTPALVPISSSFGFAGSSAGPQFVDNNIVPDYSTTPPLHLDPFARGQILILGTIAATGTFAQSTTTATIVSATGSGGVVLPVVVGGTVVAGIVQNPGGGYEAGDKVTFADATNGGTGSAPLNIGPQSGTYPGVVSYFQERRAYADSLNNPDSYWLTQPGAYTNMDAANPPVDDDAVTGNPWAQQVNGIQWLLNMPTGLLVGTGLDAWLLEGAGGPYTAVTPASQDAIAQESNGFSPTVPPVKVNYQALFVQALGSIVRALNYNYFTNTYAGEDLTVLANHLFEGRQILQWGWAREPSKVMWLVRDDGILLSLTYLKEQDVIAWARHDTNGQVVSVAVASEPPVDAVYIVVKRYIAGKQAYGYYVERFDNRLWFNAESCWCVDAGLSLPLAMPAAALSPAAASGNGVAFEASAAIFDGVTVGAPGQVIRVGGGKATVTEFVSPTQVVVDITMAITATVPNDPNAMPATAAAGNWSIGTPATSVSGLGHLEGMQVTGLADGQVIPPTTVVNGTIALPAAATAVTVGLGFQVQVQSLPLEIPGGGSVQGKRKKTPTVTVRLEMSRGVKLGSDQLNASELENYATAAWGQRPYGKMIETKQSQAQLGPGSYLPLFTGDIFTPIDSDWNRPGWAAAPCMVAAQQDYPLPMNILGFFPNVVVGDSHNKGDPS